MSKLHPIVAVTGSSGAGTSTVKRAFEHIFTREGITPAVVEGDSYHRYELHSPEEAAEHNARLGTDLNPGQFTPWEPIPGSTDLLFYEGLHGGVVGDGYDVASLADLLVGVVPITNLEWIQKIHRDNAERGYSAEAIVDTILRRMPDYINHICPQFSLTDINFQRVPTIDTSNPFICRSIPAPDESFVIIHFRKGARDKFDVDFTYLLDMIHDSFMSSPTSIVVNGGKMGFAMELILTPGSASSTHNPAFNNSTAG